MELLPRGGFKLQTENYGVIEGRFCTSSLNHFTERNGLTLMQMFDRMQSGFEIKDVASFILSAVEYKMPDKGFTEKDAMEWIDDAGGIGAMNVWANLIAQAVGGGEKAKNGQAVVSA